VSLRRGRIQLHRPPTTHQRSIVLPEAGQGLSQIPMSLRGFGSRLNGATKTEHGLFGTVQLQLHSAKVLMRLGEVRLELQRASVLRRRFFEAPRASQGASEIDAHRRIVGQID
jgi:hypothetical protein